MNNVNKFGNHPGLIRVGVFYDGNYFLHVSNYYNYVHPRKRRLSISGLHEFIRHQVAHEENTDPRNCQIVDAHYFRGRLNAQEASQRGNQLYYERVFDDILMSEGVVTHYLPLKYILGKKEEKGIDVWLALEAYELALYKQFSVLVLIASDGDYAPLVRKLNTLGTKVMVLSWDFEFTNDQGNKVVTRTSQDLLEEVSYPVAMHEIIENRVRKNEPLVNNLFVPESTVSRREELAPELDGERKQGQILSLKNGYGFIQYPPNNLFFHYSDIVNVDFNDLQEGDMMEFNVEKNERGYDVATNVSKTVEVA
jgi:cold shock CspA family protein/uncharacterized LabA/DUF88 family protein